MTLLDLHSAHLEWQAVRKQLVSGERRDFVRWLVRAHPEVAAPYRGQPALLRQQCNEVWRGNVFPKVRGIGDETLKRHLPALYVKHRSQEDQGTFLDFLNKVLAGCPTERALLRYLASAEPSTPQP